MKITKIKLKQIIREEVQKMFEAKKRQDPRFKSGDKVSHKEYGKGTVTHSGAAPQPGESRRVSVKWDDSDVRSDIQVIEPNLTKI